MIQGYKLAKYDKIWISDSGIQGLFMTNFHENGLLLLENISSKEMKLLLMEYSFKA